MFGMFIGGLIDWLLAGAVEAWKQACSFALQSSAITSGQWSVASTVVGLLAGVMIFIVILSTAVAVVRKAVAGRIGELFTIVGKAMLSWPLTMAALWVLIQINSAATTLTGKILSVDFTKPDQKFTLPELSASAAKTAFAAPLLIIMLLLIVLAAASIILCMAARSFLLIFAVSLLPVGIMFTDFGLSHKAGSGVRKYLSWVIGIILYQPVTALVIYLTGQLMKLSSSDSPLSFVTGLVGMILASVCPWILIRMISHIMPASEGIAAASHAGQKTVDKGKQTVQQAASAGMQIAGAVASGGASLAGGAGSTAASTAGGAPKVTPETADKANTSPSTSGAQGASSTSQGDSSTHNGGSMGERLKQGFGAAAAAMPSTPLMQGIGAALNANLTTPHTDGAPATSTTTPTVTSPQEASKGDNTPHVDVQVHADANNAPSVHVDQ